MEVVLEIAYRALCERANIAEQAAVDHHVDVEGVGCRIDQHHTVIDFDDDSAVIVMASTCGLRCLAEVVAAAYFGGHGVVG